MPIGKLDSWSASAAPAVERLESHQHKAARELDGAVWYRTNAGYIIAAGCMDASGIALEMQAAVEALQRYFGQATGLGAVIDIALAPSAQAVADLPVDWWLPWPLSGAAGGAATETDPLTAQLFARQPLRHEIMHRLFQTYVWPEKSNAGAYGSPAPDWLDEAAAILAEGTALTQRRRANFRRLVRGGELIPLERYLSMAHPILSSEKVRKLIRAQRASNQTTPKVVFLSGDEARSLIDSADAKFYPQTRGFLDFLLERSDNQRVLLGLMEHLQAGGSISSWLSGSVGEETSELGDNLAELERHFLHWARAR